MKREVVLRAVNISKRFGSTVALEGITLDVCAGEILDIVGPDGAGKTTLLRILAGALDGEGDLAMQGSDSGHGQAHLRGRLGYVSQRFSLYSDLTVMENLNFTGRLYGLNSAEIAASAGPLLEWSGLAPFKSRLAGRLSGGMRQKLSLISALLHKSELLLLDEPTTAVDPAARLELWRMLREVAEKGTAVVVSTVYLDEAANCDRVVLMHGGSILAGGTPQELMAILPYEVVEVVVPKGERLRAAEVLGELSGVERVVPSGSRLRVQVSQEAKPDQRTLEEALAARGIQSTVRMVEPSLEDVFVHLLEGKEVGRE